MCGLIDLEPIAGRCSPRGNICSASGQPHVVLTDTTLKGAWMTQVAQPYPETLCTSIARVVKRLKAVHSGYGVGYDFLPCLQCSLHFSRKAYSAFLGFRTFASIACTLPVMRCLKMFL